MQSSMVRAVVVIEITIRIRISAAMATYLTKLTGFLAAVLLTMIHTAQFAATGSFILMFLPVTSAVHRKFTTPPAPYVVATRSFTAPVIVVAALHTIIHLHKSAATTKYSAKAREQHAVEHIISTH